MADDEDPSMSPAPSASALPPPAAASSVGIVRVPNAEQTIPLPPLPSPTVQPEDAAGRRGDLAVLDGALCLLLLALAFLLASSPARNSDLFLHLGTGKLLAKGNYTFGVDPFACTTAGVYWVNSSWGFDLLTYGVHSLFPQYGLVALKAILVALTAGVLVLAGRGGRGWWTSIVCAGVAALALATRVPFNPVCVSYLCLAVLLWLLERPRFSAAAAPGSRPGSVASYWPVPVLFAVWVNLDGWFLLGLVVLALYALGEGVQTVIAARKERPSPALGIVLILSVAACLLNPHHFHVFTTLPTDLGLAGSYAMLKQDDTFRGLVSSPFAAGYFRPTQGLSASGLTYFGLIALGLFAFVLNYAELRWSHVLTWLMLLLLSAYQARLIPFFAVASGPILALNLQAWYARQLSGATPEAVLERWAVAGRGLTMLVGVTLLALAWPGWLQATPYEVRRWNVEEDVGLARVAGQLRQWHRTGQLKENTPGFVLSPETAHQLAWLCPEEQGFLDSRLPLFSPAVACDYLTVRAAVLGTAGPEGEEKDPKQTRWRKVLRDHHINHLVLHDADIRRLTVALQRLARVADEWPLLYLENNTAIFGWRDPETAHGPDPFAGLRLDPDRQGFHPAADKRAPAEWAGRDPTPPSWYDSYVKPRPARSPDREEAALYLAYFDAQRVSFELRHAAAWDASLAANPLGFALNGDGPSAAVDFVGRLEFARAVRHTLREPAFPPIPTALENLALAMRGRYLVSQGQGPPGVAYAAVRAARRAIHANPDDARAYFLLGEAYLRLAYQTGDRAYLGQLPLLERLRRIQAITAFNQALILQPDLAQAHERLATIFESMGYGDLLLKHLQEELKTLQAAGPQAGESQDQFKERLDPVMKHVADQQAEVRKNLDVFEVNAANFKVLDRAKQAASKGLPGKALEILEASDISAFGAEGMSLELELFLLTGRVREVREWMEPVHEDVLGPQRYALIRLLLFAATGDYAPADAELEKMAATAGGLSRDGSPSPYRGQVAALIARMILDEGVVDASPLRAVLTPLNRLEAISTIRSVANSLGQQADYSIFRAVLAVEVGDAERAEELLREYVDGLYVSSDAANSGSGLDFLGRPLAQRYLEMLTRGGNPTRKGGD